MSSFDRLSPALQYQIVNALGFRGLRPVQELTIDAVLDGDHCVVLAPTAGGKTEAAFFPLLSEIDRGDFQPVSVLYLSPIRALLNNQEARLARYAATIGRRVFKWHGDTSQAARKRFLAEPADILMTTPEALEAMLMSPRVPVARLFAGLRAVVIDEVHAFAGDDRGAHLAAVLERLSRFAGRDVQRIGLSATVGNPEEILRWLVGSSERSGRVVAPPKAPVAPALTLDLVGSVGNAALVVEKLHPGKKRLVFVDSRKGAEELGKALGDASVETYIVHGSLSQSERHESERAFAEKQNCVIVATSALELGIDVGDLDHVLQIDAPTTVASFLQRMGRTGRRAGTVPNCTFLATKDASLLQAAALLRLHASGWVEPVRPSRHAFHILAHQLMALGIQLGGVRPGDWFGWIERATPFAEVTPEDRQALIEHMLGAGILSDQDGVLALGLAGEKRYGRRNFSELYAVFSTPRVLAVRWGSREVGTLDSTFAEALDADPKLTSFSLAGRAWQLVRIDWREASIYVEPAEHGRAPRWAGSPGFLGYELCQAMRALLVSDDVDPWWSKRAAAGIERIRGERAFLRDERAPVLPDEGGLCWWSFAGGSANLLIARLLEAELGGRCVVRNDAIVHKAANEPSVAALRDALHRIAARNGPTYDDALAQAAACAGRLRLSKFEPCLPQAQLDRLVADALDVEGAKKAVAALAG